MHRYLVMMMMMMMMIIIMMMMIMLVIPMDITPVEMVIDVRGFP